ncbi:hypothetical protein FVE85_0623 [Porphyridium purpureum]|uniref:Uncharacterized protein n=1 Tax=Porphyridium purpureum TaxID=35688 RepID=A0A5J4Z1T3_PORPP|nr:hypothetical protein FVE85_0623 [Porphyridium purpureum]|eukprot:POR3142..scf208_2
MDMSQPSTFRRGRNPGTVWVVVGCALVLLLLVLVSRLSEDSSDTDSEPYAFLGDRAIDSALASKGGLSRKQKGPAKYVEIEGSDVVYRLPSTEARAVLFLAHGCSHWAFDFGRKSDACPRCVGLPAELKIVDDALKFGFVPVAISSLAGRRGCWSLDDGAKIAQRLTDFMNSVEPKLKGLPLFALGASSGGAFVRELPLYTKLSGLCLMISGLPPGVIEKVEAQLPSGTSYPPTFELYMRKPPFSGDGVEALTARNISAKAIEAHKIPVSVQFFIDRVEGMRASVAVKIVNELKKQSFIDVTGFVKQNPRKSQWREAVWVAVPEAKELNDSLIADLSPISELLNIAYSEHEITAEFDREIFDFFDEILRKQEVRGLSKKL